MRTRYIKVFRDLQSDYTKNLMLVVAIAVGVFGIGSILGAYAVISREMNNNYMGTAPASATLETESSISTSLLDSIRSFPGIKEADRRATIGARMKVEEKWLPILLFVMDDFNDLRTTKFRHISGATDPGAGGMLVERTAFNVMKAGEGGQLLVKTTRGVERVLKLSGTVHDPALAPAWQEQAGYGYIDEATFKLLDDSSYFNQLRIVVTENGNSTQEIIRKAEELGQWMEAHGHKVSEIQVPPPGQHPHQSQMNAVLKIFIVFCFLILLLGSILVAASMATLMVKHIRQIGVMKTIGGKSAQLITLYLLMVVVLSLASLIIAVPLSRVSAAAFYNQIAELLNIQIADDTIPLWVPSLQIAAAIVIPLITAAIPVIQGSRISVRKAIDNYGVSLKDLRTGSWLVRLTQSAIFNDVARLALRNAFRQRVRLIMTLGLLAAGGAMFMTAMNVSEAWDKNLSRIYTQRLYDQEIRLTKGVRADSIINKIESIAGVKVVEGWNYSPTSKMTDNKFQITRTYPDKGHGSFLMLALPPSTELLHPTLVDGRWLGSGSGEVVLNQLARGDLKIGDNVSLAVDGKPTEWLVVGFTEDVGSPATAYVSNEGFSSIAGLGENVKMLRIAYVDRSRENAVSKNREIEALLEKEKIEISSSTPVWLLHNAVAGHMKVMVNSLIAMAILMAFVGLLGLMSAMSMNVFERTREIGVMRAIGATPKKIKNLIVWEGLSIGLQSIFIAFLLGLLLSYYMGEFIGNISFRTPLSLTISTLAIVVWVLIVLVGSLIASIYPAARAGRITTREALAYE